MVEADGSVYMQTSLEQYGQNPHLKSISNSRRFFSATQGQPGTKKNVSGFPSGVPVLDKSMRQSRWIPEPRRSNIVFK